MKKITFALLTIIPLLFSCGPDDTTTIDNTGDLIRIERTYNNTGNTATLNYENNDKFKTFYYEGNLKNNLEYDNNGKMTKFTVYDDNGDVDKEYTFSYDTNGNITSVHDYDATPVFTSEPKNQDRIITWNGNKMSVPLLVGTDGGNIYDNYEFTFNSDNLLSKYKVTKASGTVRINVNFTYDSNKNPIHLSGFYDVFSVVNVDITTTYDDKNNPYFPHYDKYYINNLIILGGRPGSGFSVSNLLSQYYHFGKNNPLLIDSGNTNALYFTYDYNGNTPTTSYYRNTSSVYTTSQFVYQ